MAIETVYRGTQRESITGVRKGLSFTPSLPVAVIWSARPSDVWSNRRTQFLPTSTIHVAEVDVRQPLVLGDHNSLGLDDVLQLLDFGTEGGISEDEVRKIYNYMHNRIIGKAEGGEFAYVVLDEDGNPRDEDEVPWSFTRPETLISLARDDWDNDPSLATAAQLQADAFIFADAPTVQKVAARLGHDAIVYQDVFAGGKSASKELFGVPVEALDGVKMRYDLDNKLVPTHWTLRPLDAGVIVDVASVPTTEVLRSLEMRSARRG
jgi:hypothetical protein